MIIIFKGIYHHVDTKNLHAEDHVQYLIRFQEVVRDAINDAQTVQARYANRHRSKIAPLKIGDWVVLRRKKADKSKFASIADGSIQILEVRINNVKLKFPRNNSAHPVVNISRVQLYFGSRSEIFTELPKNDVEHDYPVNQIMDHKVIDGKHYYYIHWKDYPAEDDTWEPEENLINEILNLWRKSITNTSDFSYISIVVSESRRKSV